MKMNEIKQLSFEEIKQRFEDAKTELQNLHFQLATHQLDNQVKVRMARRDVARLKTVVHEFELGIRKKSEEAGK